MRGALIRFGCSIHSIVVAGCLLVISLCLTVDSLADASHDLLRVVLHPRVAGTARLDRHAGLGDHDAVTPDDDRAGRLPTEVDREHQRTVTHDGESSSVRVLAAATRAGSDGPRRRITFSAVDR